MVQSGLKILLSMTEVAKAMVLKRLFFSLAILVALAHRAWGGDCDPLIKPVVYRVQSGDHLADIVRTFGFYPVWKAEKGYVERLALLNEIANKNLIFSEHKLSLGFQCEQDLAIYPLIDRGDHREIDANALIKVKSVRDRETKVVNHFFQYPDGKRIAFDSTKNRPWFSAHSPLAQSETVTDDSSTKQSPDAVTDVTVGSSIEAAPLSTDSSMTDRKPSAVAASPEQNSESDFAPFSVFRVAPQYGFFRIDSTDAEDASKAFLLSEPSLGFTLAWDQVWSESLKTFVSLQHQSVKMRNASLGTLTEGSFALGEIDLGLRHQTLSFLGTELSFGYRSVPVVRSPDLNTATVDLLQAPSVGVSFWPNLLSRGSFRLDLGLGVTHILGQSTDRYTLEPGTEYQLSPRLRQQLNKMQLELKLEYETKKQNTTLTTQEDKSLKVDFGVSFEVGP